MNAVGFATTYSLVDLLDELPLPKSLNLNDNDRLLDDHLEFQNVQELQEVASAIAPVIQVARLPGELDRLRFKNPTPNIRHHHAEASPLMSIIVAHHQQFQDAITVPVFQLPQTQPQPQPQPQVQAPPQSQPQYQTQALPQQQFQAHVPNRSTSHPRYPSQVQPTQIRPEIQLPPQPQSMLQTQPQSMQQPPPQPIPQSIPQSIPQPIQQPTPQPQYHNQPQHAAHMPPQFQYQTPPRFQPPVQPQPQYRPQAQPQYQAHQPIPQTQFQSQPQFQYQQQPQLQPHLQPQLPPQVQFPPQPQIQIQPKHHAQAKSKSNSRPKPLSQPRIQSQPAKRKADVEKAVVVREKVVIDTKNSSLEEVLEKFAQDIISEQMSNFSSKQLLHLVAITAKLKRKNRTKNVNLNKLTSLMASLSSQLNYHTVLLKDGSSKDDSEDGSMDSSEGNRMQKFEICCDCAVTALNIMTSNGMDSRVYLEECVEAIILFVNTALTIITDTLSSNHCSSPKKSNRDQDDRTPRRHLFSKKCLSKLNAQCSEVLSLVNELLICRTEATLNDSLLLSTSRAALTAFFLMDTSTSSNELQLNALNVITAIFASYKNHQTVILEELIHSIARLPTTKRNRVQYQIGANNSESISIFSALIMKLIQSLFTIRKVGRVEEKSSLKSNPSAVSDDGNDYERLLKGQHNSALRASYAFLSSFLRRCCGVDKKDDCDYRVLFETFVDDLMTCLYKPDWSSAQLITHVLIKLLISNINPKPGKKNQQSTNQTMKLASLEHLGTICARLVKEKSILPKYKDEVRRALNAIDLSSISIATGQRSDGKKRKRLRLKEKSKQLRKSNTLDSDTEEDETTGSQRDDIHDEKDDDDDSKILSHRDEQRFWLALLTFCQREKSITKCARNIFCAIWLKELERRAKHQYEINNPTSHEEDYNSDEDEGNGTQPNNFTKQYSRNNNEEENQKATNGPSFEDIHASMVTEFFKLLSISAKRPSAETRDVNIENSGNQESSITAKSADEDSTIDEATAGTIIKILDLSLPTTQKLIDATLSHIIAALSTTSNTNIRSRAMKTLSQVLNNAPRDCAVDILARDDLQRTIAASLLDQSTSVRESTVELIGRFILNSQSESLIDEYYDMLTNRIMDSGVSVRKRVIKILREICMTYPSYPKAPEICSIIIKRINDEGEGIRKLVSETFTTMWFKEERSNEAIVAKVACITHVVATVWSKILAEQNKSTETESHFEWLHQLLSSLLKVKTTQPRTSEAEQDGDKEVSNEVINVQQTLAASTQIISVLVSEKLSNGSQDSNSRADCLAAMTTLWSFAKISPLLLTHYLDLIQSFLSIDPKSSFDLLILEKVIQIIEIILPSISNPSVATMNSIETNLTKLIIRGSIRVLSVSVSCLSELIHRHSHNVQLANDIFKRFLRIIRSYRANPDSFEPHQQAYFLRALYTCGLLAKHFDIEDRDTLYSELVHFVDIGISQIQQQLNPYEMQPRRQQDERVLLRSLEGLGFMFERTPKLMLEGHNLRTAEIYKFFMERAINLGYNDSAAPSICVLNNLRNYSQHKVNQDIKSASSRDWSHENLKEMTSSKQVDADSIESQVIQLYQPEMLSCALSSSVEIRKVAIKLIHSVHTGGNISPLYIVPSVIALSSDDDSTIRARADHVLQDIGRNYGNFVKMNLKQGVFESFVLNRKNRGFYKLNAEKQVSSSLPDAPSSEQLPDSQNSDSTDISAKLSTSYLVVATNRKQRRFFINTLLGYFDLKTLASAPDMLSCVPEKIRLVLSKCQSDVMQYVNDNLMFLPFTMLDEPFFLIHQIGTMIPNLIEEACTQFLRILNVSGMENEEVQENENEIDEHPVSILQVRDLVSLIRRCTLLMHCRDVISDLYGVTEQKFEDYTPNATDKPTHRRNLDLKTVEAIVNTPPTTIHFDSDPFLKSMYSDIFGLEDSAEANYELEQCAPNRHKIKLEYKRFLQMINK